MNYSAEQRLNVWNSLVAETLIVHDILLALYFVIGLTGNVFVLLVYKIKLKKESASRYFIPILAAADLLACVTRTPFDLWKNLLPVHFHDIVGCQIVWFLVNFFTFAAIFLLAVITLQRYLIVCRPFSSHMSLRCRRLLLFVIVILSLAFSVPFIIWHAILIIPNDTFNVTGYICGANVVKFDMNSDSFLSFISFIAVVTIIIMLELIILNSLIGRQIYIVLNRDKTNRKYKQDIPPGSNSESDNPAQVISLEQDEAKVSAMSENNNTNTTDNTSKEKTQVNARMEQDNDNYKLKNKQKSARLFSYMFMLIGLAFILSYLPQMYLLFSLVKDRYFWVKSTPKEILMYKFMDQMIAINNVVNPYVYGFFDLKFRKAAKQLICKLCK